MLPPSLSYDALPLKVTGTPTLPAIGAVRNCHRFAVSGRVEGQRQAGGRADRVAGRLTASGYVRGIDLIRWIRCPAWLGAGRDLDQVAVTVSIRILTFYGGQCAVDIRWNTAAERQAQILAVGVQIIGAGAVA